MAVDSRFNWRDVVADYYQEEYHLIDPTNPGHDNLSDKAMREHIKWEFLGLKQADYIILNFLSDALSPISLVELGMYVMTNKLIVVCPKDFYKWRYIDTLCKEYNTPIFTQLEQVLDGDLDTIIN